jgi:hypothetical protein
MRVRLFIPVILLALVVLGVLSAAASAERAGPGWQLFADTYPTNLVQPKDEVQQIAVSAETGTFGLAYEGSETKNPIPDRASDAEVQSALEGISSIGSGNVAVGGTPGHYEVRFIGALANMLVSELEASGAEISVATAGTSSGTIGIEVFNVGAATSQGRITVTDTLPSGVHARRAGQLIDFGGGEGHFGTGAEIETGSWSCIGNGTDTSSGVAGASVVTCIDEEPFAGGGGLPTIGRNSGLNNPQPAIGIEVEAGGEASGLTNHVSIVGGGALEPAATEDPVTISSHPAAGGVAHADAWFSNSDGTVDRQAGSHPYTATVIFDSATAVKADGQAYIPGSEIRDLETKVPPGYIGDLHAATQCTREQLFTSACPPSSLVGLLQSHALLLGFQKQIFNMVPRPGVPAELGFEYANVPVFISFEVQTGGNYAIVAHTNNIPQRELFQNIIELWGVPEESSHNHWRSRMGGCSQEEIEHAFPEQSDTVDYCSAPQNPVVTPFLTLPTQCGVPGQFAFRELNGWQEPDATSEVAFATHDAEGRTAGFSGCEALVFEPQITTSPDTAKADTPTGLTVEVRPPLGGLSEPGEGRSSADIENTVVQLPPGLVINPGQAAGLQACGSTEDELTTQQEDHEGRVNNGPAQCPNASKVGTVEIKSPLIEGDEEKQFEGNVYVLQSNPPELKLLLAATADGVNLKLVGDVSLCEAIGEVLDGKTCQATGQLIAEFKETPQLPFSVFRLSFSGGAQAALDTPAQCGSYSASADFTPWSNSQEPDFLAGASFVISEGPDGTPCPSDPLPFAPSLIAGATTDQAGGYTSFSMLLRRGDGQQRIEKLSFKVPQGLSGMISHVQQCDEPQAAQGACPAGSQIGHATVTSGPGPYPLVIPQPGEPEAPIYLTGPYGGAPFGLSIVTPVIAGPFNLGTIVTRAKIEVDPHTAQITVSTDPLPQLVKGVPTDLREVDAVIDRPGFMFNPTNCDPQTFSGTAISTQGATAPIASPFQVGSCQSLKFQPKFAVSTGARSSRLNGASLTAKLSYPAGSPGTQANITRVKVELPKQLPSRLPTLQKACTSGQFEANPAGCPSASVIGHATVRTPLLPAALQGPVYFVSHGGEAFPSLTIVLQGDGVTVQVVGATFISKKGITSTTFKTVPDVPFETFELTLPQGPYSALAAILPAKAHGSLCGQKLTMPTELIAQNGLAIHQTTAISQAGCTKTNAKAKKKHAATHRHPRSKTTKKRKH